MKHKNSYSKELIEYAKDKAKTMTKEQLRLDLQDKFNIVMDKRKFTFFSYHHGVHCIDYQPLVRYKPEMVEYARVKSQSMTIDELQQDLEQKFNFKTTRHNLQIRLYEYNIYCKDDRVQPVGYEIPCDRDRVLVKTGTKNQRKNYEYKHRLMYEKYHNVKLTDDDYIIFLNGDKTDMSEDNLFRVTRDEVNRLNGGKLYSKNKDLTKLAILSTKLRIKANKLGGRI